MLEIFERFGLGYMVILKTGFGSVSDILNFTIRFRFGFGYFQISISDFGSVSDIFKFQYPVSVRFRIAIYRIFFCYPRITTRNACRNKSGFQRSTFANTQPFVKMSVKQIFLKKRIRIFLKFLLVIVTFLTPKCPSIPLWLDLLVI